MYKLLVNEGRPQNGCLPTRKVRKRNLTPSKLNQNMMAAIGEERYEL